MSTTRPLERSLVLGALSFVFEYPAQSYRQDIARWQATYGQDFPAAAQCLQDFLIAIEPMADTQLEELYTRTFDMAPVCSPYISGHIYGDENFERGTLLTALNDRYTQTAFSTGGELPDHMAVIMRFAPKMDADEFSELVEFCLTKPLDEMIAALSGNPYEYAIMALKRLLHEEGARA